MSYDHRQYYERFLREIAAQAIDGKSATSFWIERCRDMQEDARAGSAHEFLRWPSLGAFSVPEHWIPVECYDDLRSDPGWDERWFRLTRESKTGAPRDVSYDFGTSPILVQHAYHLMRYERATQRSLGDCDVIFEVGGGYGSFCRLMKTSGFKGLHVIYDLPHVSCVQRLYLSLCGYTEVRSVDIARRDDHGVCLVTDDELDDVYHRLVDGKLRIGFVATWSLSETPMAVRERIFPRFHDLCTSYLLAFQPSWEGIDNAAYFDAVRNARPDLRWRHGDMPRVIIPPSVYLFA